MGRLNSKLRSVQGGIMHWCPGCEQAHVIYCNRAEKPSWTWNGDINRPTCTPSVLCFTTHDEEGEKLPNNARRTLCHYFLTDGNLVFCSDSPHAFVGKTIPLPDIPENYGGGE